jgi:hypothetical protein
MVFHSTEGHVFMKAFLIIACCLAILLTAFFATSTSKMADEFQGVRFSNVRGFAWAEATEDTEEGLINNDLSFKPGVINKDGALLNGDQVRRLLAAVTHEHKKHPAYKCYLPHNAFVFYDENNKPAAFVEICFDCLGRRSQPGGIAESVDYVALVTIFSELNLPFGKDKTPDDIGKRIK